MRDIWRWLNAPCLSPICLVYFYVGLLIGTALR